MTFIGDSAIIGDSNCVTPECYQLVPIVLVTVTVLVGDTPVGDIFER